ncbi:MAG: PEP-CTERM sorting domain-containing protein [Akkermansiaceae bacterium]|jgi:hypothetical protein|nr:PEP-CTERM sorting domain-containing protein [Akkermansiaceae bacterium]
MKRKHLLATSALSTVGCIATLNAATLSTVVVDSFTFTSVDSVGLQGDPFNEVINDTATGGTVINAIRVAGTLNEVNPDTWAEDAEVAITAGGEFFEAWGGGPDDTYFGPLSVGATTVLDTPIDPAGPVSFEFFESYDDPGTDQSWASVTIDFLGFTVTNGNFSLGALPVDGSAVFLGGGTTAPGGLDFYEFTLTSDLNAGQSLTITTSDPGATLTDTQLFLFDSAGNLVDTDDDGGVGLYSELAFTSGLTAGDYTAVVGMFSTENGDGTIGGLVAGIESPAGDYDISFVHNIPEPSSMMLLGLGLVPFLRRRR